MQIRHAQRGDEAQLAFLLEDYEHHYGNEIPEGAGTAGAAFLTAASPGGTLCLVAERNDGRLVGFAILNPYFPAEKLTHGLFLKELYVAAEARSQGVGEKLIEAIQALAKERGDTNVVWTTGQDNAGSQRFYDRLGMRREEKVYYVMDGW
ncbi:MAG: GNAT family N-acetyltransferase [Enhydrobacter sp.]|nr:MAG: GNAT family N-acetyltransferase [Enhydrobacter sp.]